MNNSFKTLILSHKVLAARSIVAIVTAIAINLLPYLPLPRWSCFFFFRGSCLFFTADIIWYIAIFLCSVAAGVALRFMKLPHPLFTGIFGGLIGTSVNAIVYLSNSALLDWLLCATGFLVSFYLMARLADTKINTKLKIVVATIIFVALWIGVRYTVWRIIILDFANKQ